MARKKKKKKKKRLLDPHDVLDGRVPVSALELIRLIHGVNPTRKEVDAYKVSDRYRLKARLQSLLIRRFSEGLRVEAPMPENPDLVGLRLSRFDEDACHALIRELDDDAASWVRRRVDEEVNDAGVSAEDPEEAPETADPLMGDGLQKEMEPVATGEDLSADECIRLGKIALDRYDYDACEGYFRSALKASAGGVEAAVSVLELYVDHLGVYDKALAVSADFSSVALKDERVKLLLGLSSVHSGHFEAAMDYVDRITHSRVAEVYLPAARHFIEKGIETFAAKALSKLKTYAGGAQRVDVEELERQLRLRMAEQMTPLEKDMMKAWEEDRLDAALTLADKIMSVLPDNREAQQVRHKVLKRQCRVRISRLLRDADDAERRRDFAREADLLAKAVALGAHRDELSNRLLHARNLAEKQREETAFSDLEELWEDGRREATLTGFLNFDEKKRNRFAGIVQHPHFRWLNEMLSADKAFSRKKAVDAVLALGRAKMDLDAGENPDSVIMGLKAHAGVLQSVRDARIIMEQAALRARTMASSENRDLLARAARFLSKTHQDLDKAEQALSAVKIGYLDEADKHHLENLKSKHKRLESLGMLRKQYASSAARGDHFACMDVAEKLAELDDDEVSDDWNGKVRNHEDAVKREWSLLSFDMRHIPEAYGCKGMPWMSERNNCLLLPDGRNAVLVTSHGRWIFIRTFCVDDQIFRDGIVFRTPEKMVLPRLFSVGKMLWIVGEESRVTALCLDPLTIRYWHDFSSFATDDQVIEDTLIFPDEKIVWLQKRNSKKYEEIIEVIRWDLGRTIRRINWSTLLIPVNHGGRFEVAMADWHQKTVRICTEKGKTVQTILFEEPRILDGAVPHPNGVDYVLLTHKDLEFHDPMTDTAYDGDESDNAALTVRATPDPDKKIAPLVIDDTDGEYRNTMAILNNTGIIFVYFMSHEGSDAGLLALKPSKEGFDPIYRVPAPKKLIIFSNEHSDGLVAIGPSSAGLKAVRLDAHPPSFEGMVGFEEMRYFFPSFDAIWECDVETGAFKAETLARTLQLKEIRQLFYPEQLKNTKFLNDPDQVAVLIRALGYMGRWDEAKYLRHWLKNYHPGHCRVLMEAAKNAAKKQDWPRVISLLEKVVPRDLDDGTARHRCHLLGMAYFAEGDAEKALRIWKRGKRYKDGRCNLDPYIIYARLSLKDEKQRKRSRIGEDMKRGLALFETVDQYMNSGDWKSVVMTMESAGALAIPDLQLQARLARAYLNQDLNPEEPRFICKLLVLADYREKYHETIFRKNQPLPSHLETWSEARLKETENEARDWLRRNQPSTSNSSATTWALPSSSQVNSMG